MTETLRKYFDAKLKETNNDYGKVASTYRSRKYRRLLDTLQGVYVHEANLNIKWECQNPEDYQKSKDFYKLMEELLLDDNDQFLRLCKTYKISSSMQSDSSKFRAKHTQYKKLNLNHSKCLLCGADKKLNRHHIDCDATNNTLNNIALLCNECHRKAHGIGGRNVYEHWTNNITEQYYHFSKSGKRYSKYRVIGTIKRKRKINNGWWYINPAIKDKLKKIVLRLNPKV